jgi:hypothetical protein
MALDTAVIVTQEDTLPQPAEGPATPTRDDQGRFASTTPSAEPAAPTLVDTPAADQTPVTAPVADPVTASAPVPVDKKSPQARINQAIQRQREAERLRDAAVQRATDLEQRLSQPPPAPPEGDLSPDQFETFDAYIEEKVRRLAEKTSSERVQQLLAEERVTLARTEALRVQTAILAEHQQRFERGRQSHADFDEVIQQDIPLSAPMEDAIVHSPVGEELAYYLGTHPDEAIRIKDLPPGRALVEMGILQATIQLRHQTASPGPALVTPRVSQTPAPIRPVSAASHAPVGSLDELPLHEFMRIRNKAEWERGR